MGRRPSPSTSRRSPSTPPETVGRAPRTHPRRLLQPRDVQERHQPASPQRPGPQLTQMRRTPHRRTTRHHRRLRQARRCPHLHRRHPRPLPSAHARARRRMAALYGVKAIFIDYLQLMTARARREPPGRVSAISRRQGPRRLNIRRLTSASSTAAPSPAATTAPMSISASPAPSSRTPTSSCSTARSTTTSATTVAERPSQRGQGRRCRVIIVSSARPHRQRPVQVGPQTHTLQELLRPPSSGGYALDPGGRSSTTPPAEPAPHKSPAPAAPTTRRPAGWQLQGQSAPSAPAKIGPVEQHRDGGGPDRELGRRGRSGGIPI